jgi:hypothetical protein
MRRRDAGRPEPVITVGPGPQDGRGPGPIRGCSVAISGLGNRAQGNRTCALNAGRAAQNRYEVPRDQDSYIVTVLVGSGSSPVVNID